MPRELLVLTGRPLPSGFSPLGVVHEGVEVYELIHGTQVQSSFMAVSVLSVTASSGFIAHSVAAAIACATSGVVYDELQGQETFDGRGWSTSANLEEVIRRACADAERSWKAIVLAHREQAAAHGKLMSAVEPVAGLDASSRPLVFLGDEPLFPSDEYHT